MDTVCSIANEMHEAWKAVRQGDGEFTLDVIDNWVSRLNALRLYDCQICGGVVDMSAPLKPTVGFRS